MLTSLKPNIYFTDIFISLHYVAEFDISHTLVSKFIRRKVDNYSPLPSIPLKLFEEKHPLLSLRKNTERR